MSPADKKKLIKDIQKAGYGKVVNNDKYVDGAVEVGEAHKLKEIRTDDPIVVNAFVSAEDDMCYYIQDFEPITEKEYLLAKLS